MSRKSIFEIERRNSFLEMFNGFYKDVKDTAYPFSDLRYIAMIDYLDHCIKYWPYRGGTSSISQYLNAIGINIEESRTNMDMLLIMELLINLLHWASKQIGDEHADDPYFFQFEYEDIMKEVDRLLLNAETILELSCNMQIREIKGNPPKYIITKRDAIVDAVIDKNHELANDLLGYLDIRNKQDIKYKESVLLNLYGYLEPNRKDYKTLSCGSISEEFFRSMNRFGIRHNTKSQVIIPPNEKISVYDKLFKMALYVLQASEVNGYKEEMKALRDDTVMSNMAPDLED